MIDSVVYCLRIHTAIIRVLHRDRISNEPQVVEANIKDAGVTTQNPLASDSLPKSTHTSEKTCPCNVYPRKPTFI